MPNKNSQPKRVWFVLSIFLVSIFVGCNNISSTSDVTLAGSQEKVSEAPAIENESNMIEGSVIKQENSEWSAIEVQVGEPVSHVFFIDNDQGWACNKEFIYRTVNAGRTWEAMPIDVVGKKDDVKGIYFDNDRQGWLIVQFDPLENEFSKDDEVRVYRTSNGGKKWELSVRQPSSTVSDFLSSFNNRWLIGQRFLGNHPQRLAPLVLHFSEVSKTWEDLSDRLIDFFNSEKDRTYSFPFIARMTALSADCVLIATEEQSVIQSCDVGHSWQLVDEHGHNGYRIGINQIGVDNGRVWLLEATGGVEGTGSRVAFIDPDSGQKAKSILLGGYFLVKGYWISDQEFIAAGTAEPVVQRQTKDRYDRSKKIVILHTNDGGVTWSEIYNSPGNGNDYYFSSRDVMWLVNMDGKLYKIAGKLGPDL